MVIDTDAIVEVDITLTPAVRIEIEAEPFVSDACLRYCELVSRIDGDATYATWARHHRLVEVDVFEGEDE